MNKFSNVYVVNHPLCCHNLSIIRNKDTNAEENAQLKSDLEQAQKQIEQLKKDAERASELSSKVEKINKASLWQRITKKFD